MNYKIKFIFLLSLLFIGCRARQINDGYAVFTEGSEDDSSTEEEPIITLNEEDSLLSDDEEAGSNLNLQERDELQEDEDEDLMNIDLEDEDGSQEIIDPPRSPRKIENKKGNNNVRPKSKGGKGQVKGRGPNAKKGLRKQVSSQEVLQDIDLFITKLTAFQRNHSTRHLVRVRNHKQEKKKDGGVLLPQETAAKTGDKGKRGVSVYVHGLDNVRRYDAVEVKTKNNTEIFKAPVLIGPIQIQFANQSIASRNREAIVTVQDFPAVLILKKNLGTFASGRFARHQNSTALPQYQISTDVKNTMKNETRFPSIITRAIKKLFNNGVLLKRMNKQLRLFLDSEKMMKNVAKN